MGAYTQYRIFSYFTLLFIETAGAYTQYRIFSFRNFTLLFIETNANIVDTYGSPDQKISLFFSLKPIDRWLWLRLTTLHFTLLFIETFIFLFWCWCLPRIYVLVSLFFSLKHKWGGIAYSLESLKISLFFSLKLEAFDTPIEGTLVAFHSSFHWNEVWRGACENSSVISLFFSLKH